MSYQSNGGKKELELNNHETKKRKLTKCGHLEVKTFHLVSLILSLLTLASRGLEEPAHALRGLEEPFFQLCCCVSFWFWREIVFGVTSVLSVQYSCAVVSFFCCGGKVT